MEKRDALIKCHVLRVFDISSGAAGRGVSDKHLEDWKSLSRDSINFPGVLPSGDFDHSVDEPCVMQSAGPSATCLPNQLSKSTIG